MPAGAVRPLVRLDGRPRGRDPDAPEGLRPAHTGLRRDLWRLDPHTVSGGRLGDIPAGELRAMLRLRRAELEAAMTAAAARLAQVEARLRSIESEGQMPVNDVVLKSLPSVRLAELTAVATDFDSIGPVIQPLYDELFRRLEAAGIAPSGPGVAHYEDAPEGGVLVHAGVEVSAPLGEDDGLRVVDLPPVEQAATVVHRGSMEAVLPTVQSLGRWIDSNGYRSAGHPREVNLECPEDRDDWVTELQEPVRKASPGR
ncbi:GyrI-like domain-containing protein [Streptomyces goshikiensis]|uniref:GyrI-like domain-containing protein n=1 Tax=Streptomyces goshikiensis TaxID=1942 RepID=UPI0036AC69C3